MTMVMITETHTALVVALLLLLPGISRGAYTRAAATSDLCCGSLNNAGFADRLLYPNSTNYEEREKSFFSLNEELNPWCIFQPHSTDEVSGGVQTLVATGSCQFAVRSGGHHHAAGINNIHEGVTVDLGKMNSVFYNPDNSTTSIQPGALWGDVYGTLDPMNLTVAGGRDATVGVAGLLIGGGNNFYSARRGMACDGVRRFEVVLGTGEVIVADNSTNSDLFQVLKGGNNNFGIVTRFDLDTFETGQLWGGAVYYPLDAGSDLVDAFVKFGDAIDDNTASSSILFWTYQPSAGDILIGTSFVNVDGVVMDEAHQDFYPIQNSSSTMRTTNITDLTIELEFAGEIYTCVEYTISFKNDARVINKVVDLHNQYVDEMKKQTDDFISVAMFQPLALSIAAGGVARGGNVLGLDSFEETRIMCIIWLQVKPELVSLAEEKVSTWFTAVDDYAASISMDSDWLYLNYAYGTQDPLDGYGQENLRKIATAAKKYDPYGVFQTFVPGGFKVSKVYPGFDDLEVTVEVEIDI